MTRLFLLPMLLKRALESDPIRKTRTSVRESHDELKALQQAELTKTDVRVEGQFRKPITFICLYLHLILIILSF